MIGSLPGAGPDQRLLVLHGHRIDITRQTNGQWEAVLHKAPHRPLCRAAPLDVVVRRVHEWTREQLDAHAAGVQP